MNTKTEKRLPSGWLALATAGVVGAILLAGGGKQTEPDSSAVQPGASVAVSVPGPHARSLAVANVPVAQNAPRDSSQSEAPELPASVEELSEALANPDPNARIDAVSGLGDIDDEHAVSLLAGVASRDRDPAVRAEALHAMGGRNDTSIPALIQALADPDAAVRKAGINAFSYGSESALPALAMAMQDPDASVRVTAVNAIGEIGGSGARPLLESGLADQSSIVREAAREQLLQFP